MVVVLAFCLLLSTSRLLEVCRHHGGTLSRNAQKGFVGLLPAFDDRNHWCVAELELTHELRIANKSC